MLGLRKKNHNYIFHHYIQNTLLGKLLEVKEKNMNTITLWIINFNNISNLDLINEVGGGDVTDLAQHYT